MTFIFEIVMLTTIAYILIAWICIIIVIFCFRCFVSYILYPFFIFIKRNIISYYLSRFSCYKCYQIIFVFSLYITVEFICLYYLFKAFFFILPTALPLFPYALFTLMLLFTFRFSYFPCFFVPASREFYLFHISIISYYLYLL